MTIQISPRFSRNADIVLYEGDCLELLKTLPNNFVSLIVTSPPYNLGKEYEKKSDLTNYIKKQVSVIEQCARVLKENGSICWQVGNFVDNCEVIPLDIILYPIFHKLKLQLRNRIIWHFGHGLHASKRFSGRYETILWFTKNSNYLFKLDPVRVPQKYPNKKHFKGPKRGTLSGNPLGKNPGDVWIIPNVKANHVEKTSHPCQFPVELIERLVLSMTNEGDWVLDPYIGTGSTAIAALIHNRKSVGAEIMPDYVKIAKHRLKQADQGTLRIRPLERMVYDPIGSAENIPPKVVWLNGKLQPRLFEERGNYKKRGG